MRGLSDQPVKRFRAAVHHATNHVILCVGTAFVAAPLALLVLASMNAAGAIPSFESEWTPNAQEALENYRAVANLEAGFSGSITALQMLKNSLIIATGIATLSTAVSMAAAYAIVYFRLPLAGLLFWVTMATLLLPLEGRFVTTFEVAATLGLINTYGGMILPALAIALGTLFFRQLFLTFPDQYLEAAKLDGAGPWRFFVDFIVPLSWRRAGAIFVVSFMIGWHQYLWPLLLSTDETHYTVLRGLELIGLQSGPGMALAVLTVLPPLMLVVMFQRYFFADFAAPRDGQ